MSVIFTPPFAFAPPIPEVRLPVTPDTDSPAGPPPTFRVTHLERALQLQTQLPERQDSPRKDGVEAERDGSTGEIPRTASDHGLDLRL